MLTEVGQLKAPDVGIRVRTLRLVSLSERAVGLQLIQLEIEDGEVEVTLEASFEGMDLGLVSERLDQDLGVWRTQHSGKSLAMATAASLQVDGHDLPPTALGQLKWSWSWKSRPGQVVCFERFVAVARSDAQDLDPGSGARDKLDVARQLGWRGVVAEHEAAWASRWQCSDVEVDGDAAAQQALRFAVYHLNSAANPADERVSIGARALTGDDYHGHVFWDTEIFLLPFYILTWPEAARALLMYRFHTLDARAGESGRDGLARRPVRLGVRRYRRGDDAGAGDRSGSSGRRRPVRQAGAAHQRGRRLRGLAILAGDRRRRVPARRRCRDPARDGRFWSSRAQLEADGCCHIRGVIGPDEYHEHIDDNAFTNVMARWNIRRALDVAALLRERWPERWASLVTPPRPGRRGTGAVAERRGDDGDRP